MDSLTLWCVLSLFAPDSKLDLAYNYPETYKAIYWPQPNTQVANLINQLSSPKWKERNEATDQLKQLGWQALGGCNQALNHPDHEVKARCTKVISHYYNYKYDFYPSVFSLKDIEFKIKDTTFSLNYTQIENYYLNASAFDDNYNIENAQQVTANLTITFLTMGIDPSELTEKLDLAIKTQGRGCFPYSYPED